MDIRFFNTLSGEIENFEPITPGVVKMYTCGPTVYDYAHIGNFRAFVFEDLLRRFLAYRSLKVKHVMNLTDVDDKTIAGAAREKMKLEDFTKKYVEAFNEDLKMLNILSPACQPKATEEILPEQGMIELIQVLINKDVAYESDGSVYFRVSKFSNYGKLSKKKLDQNIQGARVDVDEYDKEEGADFVLWKKSKEGEPFWDSPWGKGRPGWHIECSAMSMKYLGETFDLHAGGEDLIFPHHENEIAQSEAATGKPFVHYWLHCKFLLVNSEKMSKSKGNFYTLRSLMADGHDPMAIRYALLSTHYRTPLNFTLDGLKEAAEVIKKLDDCYYYCLSLKNHARPDLDEHAERMGFIDLREKMVAILNQMSDALANDLNIAETLRYLFEAIKEINYRRSQAPKVSLGTMSIKAILLFFAETDQLLGLDISKDQAIPDEIESLRAQRDRLRGSPQFKTDIQLREQVDALREKMKSLGWLPLDRKPGEFSTVRRLKRTWDKS